MTKQYRLRNQTVTVTSADGASGVLCRSIDGKYFFRIYHDDGEFTDYDLAHLDLAVTIHDESAAFYTFADKTVLDYSPEVYGYEELSSES